ncbi:MAG: rRNA pseudouridine synthase [Saprospiraceae bacterium]|nr:rRNA pseudouridine synthase [Saprospiraceae bacterium]
MMRLNKFIAHSGVCSRRKAADLVKAGEIEVNGKVEINPAVEVSSEDVVTYKGKVLKPEQRKVYILLNKPKNTVTTLKDEKGRRTVMDILRNKVKERIYPVGRLDRATTGLLLLTNDGDLAKKLSHPSHKVKKYYHVVLDKDVSEEHLEQIKKGLQLEDGLAIVDEADYIKGKGKAEVGLEIHIGKNRIVRRIFEHLGYRVIKLDRTYYAGLTKKDLPRGWHRLLTKQEVIMLKHFI